MTEYMNAQISSAIYIIVDFVVKRRNPIFMKLHLDMWAITAIDIFLRISAS